MTAGRLVLPPSESARLAAAAPGEVVEVRCGTGPLPGAVPRIVSASGRLFAPLFSRRPSEVHPAPAVGAEVWVPHGGIYVASRASITELPTEWRRLRDAGWPIVSSWIDESGPGESNFSELWPRCLREIRGSAALAAFVRPEDLPVRGVFIEIGVALACDLPVFVACQGCGPEFSGSWMRHPQVTAVLAASQEELLRATASRTRLRATVTALGARPYDCEECRVEGVDTWNGQFYASDDCPTCQGSPPWWATVGLRREV